MTVVQGRGGIPRVKLVAATATGVQVQFPFFTSYVTIRSDDVVKVYFTEADMTNDENYVQVELPAAANPQSGGWDGPVESHSVWLQCPAAGTANVEVVGFQRRG